MIDVKENNWLLPLNGETHNVDQTRWDGLQVRIAHEVPPIFHSLNTASWWYDHFEQYGINDLRSMCKKLGIQTSGNKNLLVAVLAKYWRDRIRDGKEAT